MAPDMHDDERQRMLRLWNKAVSRSLDWWERAGPSDPPIRPAVGAGLSGPTNSAGCRAGPFGPATMR